MTQTTSDTKSRQRRIYRTTIVGSVGNLLLVVFKFVAGILGHSSAMIADAVHSVSDFVTDVVVLLFVRIAGKPKDCDHNYGHGKYETMATALIGLMLLGVGLGIFWSGATKIWDFYHGVPLEAPGMLALIAALVSILVKEALYRYTVHVGKEVDSQALIANAWHHRSDAFSSIATAVGVGGAILLGSSWRVLDPIAAVVVCVLIIKVAIELLIPSVNELLDKSLPKETEQRILEVVGTFPQVSDPHNLRTRKVGPVSSIEMHLRMNGNLTVAESHKITRDIEAAIRNAIGPETIINIHVEPTPTHGK